MNIRTLRVAIGSKPSEEKQIEDGFVQRAVLSVTLFIVAMADLTHGIEEPIKVIGYADDWRHGQNRQMGRQHRLSKNKSHHVQPQKHWIYGSKECKSNTLENTKFWD
jgi:hypothetical protein